MCALNFADYFWAGLKGATKAVSGQSGVRRICQLSAQRTSRRRVSDAMGRWTDWEVATSSIRVLYSCATSFPDGFRTAGWYWQSARYLVWPSSYWSVSSTATDDVIEIASSICNRNLGVWGSIRELTRRSVTVDALTGYRIFYRQFVEHPCYVSHLLCAMTSPSGDWWRQEWVHSTFGSCWSGCN